MYDRKDAYYRKAKAEGFRSRAAYKLQQIAKAEKLIRPGDAVVDAGAAPGGWTQVLSAMVGSKGSVLAIDILPMEPLPFPNVTIWKRDLTEECLPDEALAALGRKADAVVSDAAPNTTGSAFTDQARSADLVRTIFLFSEKVLKPSGLFLAKVYAGSDSDDVFRELKPRFDSFKRIRPEATRQASFEIYLLGKGFKG